MLIRYVGPQAAVEIAESGQVVEAGREADVEDALATRLLEQPDVWEDVSGGRSEGPSRPFAVTPVWPDDDNPLALDGGDDTEDDD